MSVSRAFVPAPDIVVYGRIWLGSSREPVRYAAARTNKVGQAQLSFTLPARSRGDLRVQLEAFSPVAEIPCLGSVQEHGIVEGRWGRTAP